MSDEQPKRFKGAKHLEAGYRAGHADGFADGEKIAEEREYERQRTETRMAAGLAKLRADQQAKPKRTRRAKVRDVVPAESTAVAG